MINIHIQSEKERPRREKSPVISIDGNFVKLNVFFHEYFPCFSLFLVKTLFNVVKFIAKV